MGQQIYSTPTPRSSVTWPKLLQTLRQKQTSSSSLTQSVGSNPQFNAPPANAICTARLTPPSQSVPRFTSRKVSIIPSVYLALPPSTLFVLLALYLKSRLPIRPMSKLPSSVVIPASPLSLFCRNRITPTLLMKSWTHWSTEFNLVGTKW